MRRLRFSLATVIFLTTITAMALVIALFWREIGPLRTEVQRLRGETGQLTIDDPTKIYIIAIPQPDDAMKHWKWRIYLPANHQYILHTVTSPVPETGYASSGTYSGQSVWLSGGEQVFEVSLGKDADGSWCVHNLMRHQDTNTTTTSTVSMPQAEWVDGPGGSASSGVTVSQQSFEADKTVDLLRLRPLEFVPRYPGADDPTKKWMGSTKEMKGPTDGILIWIDQQQ
jgi:hypothetical protein